MKNNRHDAKSAKKTGIKIHFNLRLFLSGFRGRHQGGFILTDDTRHKIGFWFHLFHLVCIEIRWPKNLGVLGVMAVKPT